MQLLSLDAKREEKGQCFNLSSSQDFEAVMPLMTVYINRLKKKLETMFRLSVEILNSLQPEAPSHHGMHRTGLSRVALSFYVDVIRREHCISRKIIFYPKHTFVHRGCLGWSVSALVDFSFSFEKMMNEKACYMSGLSGISGGVCYVCVSVNM